METSASLAPKTKKRGEEEGDRKVLSGVGATGEGSGIPSDKTRPTAPR
jgi:hypothetical protein